MLKALMCSALASIAFISYSQVDTYDVADLGYLCKPMESKSGLVFTNNRYSEIYLLKGSELKPIVSSRGCGLFTQLNKEKTYIGFKSINNDDLQAPAILNISTGAITLLEDYVWECGQVSFSDNGTMAYTMGNNLIIRKDNNRKVYDLGFYTNIVNISPDAKHVAYSNIDGRYFIINLENSLIEQIPVLDGYDGVWSPDGSKLAIHTATGKISVFEKSSGKIYDLGHGLSANWANNSEELIYTTIERKHELYIEGSSVRKIKYNGSNAITLVESTEDMPTDAILTTDNQLIIPYAGELKRCVTIRALPKNSISTGKSYSAPQEKVIYDIIDGEFGARLENINKTHANNFKNIKGDVSLKMEGTIGQLDIPYLNQIYDSPAVNGCTKHGYVTCAPTTACMFLGYYDLLPKKATTNRLTGATKYYAHAISSVFTSKSGGTTFSTTAYGNGCYNVPGGYGYMWNGSRTPGGGYMASFMKLNGCTSADYLWNASSAWSKFASESKAGRPSPLCIALRSGGHLILGFRTNCYYRTSEGGFVNRNGCFVCHDPYGDCNDNTWADNDGQHSSYDWIGYNSGRQNIGTFYWSIYATVPVTSIPTEAKITCTPSSVSLSDVYQSSKDIYTDVKVTATGLSKTMSINAINSSVVFEKLSGWNDLTGGTLRIYVNPNYILGMGSYAGYIAIQSGSDENNDKVRTEIITDIQITDENGNLPDSEGPEALPDDSTTPGTVTTDIVTDMTEIWNYSYKNNQTADWITNGQQVTQDFTFNNGKLYVVHRKDNSDNKIYIVDAYTGKKTGELNVSPCTVGTHLLSSIETIGGKIIACNLAASAASVFNIYLWDNDNATPKTLLSTTSHNDVRVGDAMSVSGDLTNGKIWFAYNSSVFYYTIKDGAIASTTPNVIDLKKADGTTAYNISNSSAVSNITIESDNSFWVTSKDYRATHFDSSGKYIEEISSSILNDAQGTDIKFIALGSKRYAVVTTYLRLATPTGATNSTLSDGSFEIFDVTNGISSATKIGTYPSAGLGNIRNTSLRTSLCTEVNDTDLNVWVLIPYQGAAYYKFNHTIEDTETGIENLEVETETPVIYYNLQGVQVSNPDKGLYIKRQGNKVTKIIF